MTKANVLIKNYDPNWELQFEEEKEKILSALPKKIIHIEHIGSTSIKGLGAKPIIDIMIGVTKLEDFEELIQPLSTFDFEYVSKPELTDRRFFRKGLWGQGTCHLHICKHKSKEWIEKLLFRDYLRENPKIAEDYLNLKKSLANEYQYDRQTYTKKKEPFIREVIKCAGNKFY
ncbi:GrpB family protein [Gottfriedia acidiceleris]|uniref:GrpB family protein n=1 Tax=Gottfriedia acidiceleris TaxID=371036 RepID=UPI00101CB415|nr:GrpB family protein [Gottfriedia acidiceleris]